MDYNPLEVSLTDVIRPSVTRLADYVQVYDDICDEETCDQIVEAFESQKEKHVYIDRLKRPTFTEMNVSQEYLKRDVTWMSIQQQIQAYFIESVSRYMSDLDLGADFPSKYAFEEYRIKKYRQQSDDEFADHVDVGDYNSARRFLVCFLYLNDVEEGGTTDFPKISLSITPKRARILLFPPNWMYRHAGRPVTKGTKYILGTYLHYL
tara:strand:+ start:2761 stop:3381 length:621 start_codon:yes stop_codon:yes gene_type:complete